MLSKLFSRSPKSPTTPPPQVDERLAVGALMVRVAKSDHTYKFEEISRIDKLLAQIFDLNPVEAAKMRATCEKLEASAPDTDEFAKVIRDHVDKKHRIEAHEALWQVMLADGVKHDEEMQVIEQSRAVLGLSEEECNAAHDRMFEA